MHQIAKKEEAYLFEIRNHLHTYPELSWEENQSLAFVEAELKKFTPSQGRQLNIYNTYKGGLVADLTTTNPHKHLLFRADIDALPIIEDPSHKIISKTQGKMHACGHDAHSAMLLTAAKLLMTDASIPLQNNIRFVWQRAEENPEAGEKKESGGLTLVKEGVLEKVDEVYGIHLWAKAKGGMLGSARNAIFGNTTTLHIQIHATGGHTSEPHQGSNALRVAQSIAQALQDFPRRYLGPYKPFSLEPTILQSGEASNVMPAYADLWYSVRTFLPSMEEDAYLQAIGNVIDSISKQYEAKIDVKFKKIYPATINNEKLFLANVAYLNANDFQVEEMTPILAGEDFSYYLEQRPGVFWILGANQPTSGPHHSPTFDPDPSVFHKGVALWLTLAINPNV